MKIDQTNQEVQGFCFHFRPEVRSILGENALRLLMRSMLIGNDERWQSGLSFESKDGAEIGKDKIVELGHQINEIISYPADITLFTARGQKVMSFCLFFKVASKEEAKAMSRTLLQSVEQNNWTEGIAFRARRSEKIDIDDVERFCEMIKRKTGELLEPRKTSKNYRVGYKAFGTLRLF